MAITKIMNMKAAKTGNMAAHLKHSLEYICNKAKTDNGNLVGSINCLPDFSFEQMIQTLGTEFDILRNVPSEDIKSCAGERIAEGIENVRTGNVKRIPGYDGEYGKIELFDEN